VPKVNLKVEAGRQIFISYCHANYADAFFLHRALEPMCRRLGDTAIFLDSRALKGGDEWEPKILAAVETADVFVVLLSHAYNGSKFCMDIEFRRIFERRTKEPHIRVIGVALHKIELQDFFVEIDSVRVSISSKQCLPQDVVDNGVERRLGLKPISDWPESRLPDAWELVKMQIEDALLNERGVGVSPPQLRPHPDEADEPHPRQDLSVDWLPYLCDRGDQLFALGESLDAWQRSDFSRPLVLVTEGRLQDSLRKWIERLQRHEIRKGLGLKDEELSFGYAKSLNWPTGLNVPASPDEARRRAVRALAEVLGPRPGATEIEVRSCYAACARATFLSAECSDKNEPDKVAIAVGALLNVLGDFPNLGRQNLLVVALNLVRPPVAEPSGPSRLRDKVEPLLAEAVTQGRLAGAMLYSLSELSEIDIRNWASADEVSGRLEDDVDSLIGRNLPSDQDCWPMQTFADIARNAERGWFRRR